MKVGFYPGSFDPFTKGHLHVVKTSSELFDKVVIAIGVNAQKSRRYEKDEMKQAIEETLKNENIVNVEVITFSGLSVDVAKQYGCHFLIRGIRNDMDYYYEENMAQLNEDLSGLDTIYIRAGKMGAISSSIVMELENNGRDVKEYVPEAIYNSMRKSKK